MSYGVFSDPEIAGNALSMYYVLLHTLLVHLATDKSEREPIFPDCEFPAPDPLAEAMNDALEWANALTNAPQETLCNMAGEYDILLAQHPGAEVFVALCS